MAADDVVQILRLVALRLKLGPRVFQHLKHHVVVEIGGKMCHLVPQDMNAMHHGAQFRNPISDSSPVFGVLPPCRRQRILHPFQAPQKTENRLVPIEHVRRNDGGQG